VDGHVHDGEERIRVALGPVALDGGADAGLGKDEVGEVGRAEGLGVGLELLGDEALEGDVVDIGVRVEELEVDVDEALLRAADEDERSASATKAMRGTHDVAVVAVVVCGGLLAFGHRGRR
jgi:hypothetical protein